ncbi:Acg family FMN-binding oxidoreductase [Streptomyces sp. NPDC058683]|uniref:Acg family FMN-binding oxidoreductase n=1 Tax=Streptomyces sp. NPDC058683 TaxID=3346597 RepID=UPI003652AA5B
MSRRSAMKLVGLGLGTIAAAGVGVGGVRAATNGAFSAGSGDPYGLWHDWTTLSGIDRVVAAGVLACNPHNTQAWRIAVNGDTIHVYSDARRRMPLNDASAREHFAGLGCAVENMVIAAGPAGFTAHVTLFPDGIASDHVARIALRDGGTGQDRDLAAAIPHRHTNRGPYKSTPVDLGGFTEQSSRIDGASVLWITDKAAREQLGRLYVEATEAITADTAQSTEAFSWFRSARSTIDRHRDGLTLDGQGLGGLTLFAAKLLPAQSRKDGDAFWVKATREVHTATAAAYGVITVDDVTNRMAQVSGGRLLARMHLTATSLGLGLHHMNQITERIDRDRAAGSLDVFSARWAAVLGRPAPTGLLSFRIGHPERTPGLSPRRSLKDVLTT